MKCEEVKSLTDLYLDGQLTEELSAGIDRHILRCTLCAGEIRSLEQVRSLLRGSIAPAEPSAAYRERAAAQLRDRLSEHLRVAEPADDGRQWILPFARLEL